MMEILDDLLGRRATPEEQERAKEFTLFTIYASEECFDNYIKDKLTEEEFDSVAEVLQELGCFFLFKSFLERHTS